VTGLGPLGDVVALLDRLTVPYMVVGSVAAMAHGADRSTTDVDLVVTIDPVSTERLIQSLDRDRWYLPDDAARAAAAGGGSFNLIDLRSTYKFDVMVRRDREFSRVEFGRRRPVDVGAQELWVASAEDTVLAKLEWGRDGGSDRQIEDAAAVLAVSGPSMDAGYLDRWAAELGVTDLLAEARRRAGGG
jgi:hypothetical protein